MHATLRAREGLPNFRTSADCDDLVRCIRAASRSPAVGDAFRVVHFSIQSNHIHFIVEAADNDALSRGMQGLAIRLARAVNRTFDRIHGSVWADRYHARPLETARQVRNAIVYVLMNAKKHQRSFRHALDVLSSAPWFDGIRDNVVSIRPSPVMLSRTHLGSVAWRRRGLIGPHEKPS